MKDSIQEQSICNECGFCCDGTLFENANLKPGEKGNLPKYLEDNYLKIGDNEVFLQPCAYYTGKCSIYDKKPLVCSSFRCQLLKDFSAIKVDFERAIKIVSGGKLMRADIYRLYSKVYPAAVKRLYFRIILEDLSTYQKESFKNNNHDQTMKILIAKCNVFETLLIRYFKSADDYNRMIETDIEM